MPRVCCLSNCMFVRLPDHAPRTRFDSTICSRVSSITDDQKCTSVHGLLLCRFGLSRCVWSNCGGSGWLWRTVIADDDELLLLPAAQKNNVPLADKILLLQHLQRRRQYRRVQGNRREAGTCTLLRLSPLCARRRLASALDFTAPAARSSSSRDRPSSQARGRRTVGTPEKTYIKSCRASASARFERRGDGGCCVGLNSLT
jgi:hypothetical protein